ncbi:MAG TPA: translocation/assembly module TamB domain-containing protein [Candidatus Acidoferrales bacterium]|nr:translocation/assembly module TamB domain-containing protein [Candidatus Acidoferrales bacterium]
MNLKRSLKWLAVVVLALIALACAGILFVQHSSGFHRWLLAQMISRADQATGGRLEIRGYEIHWWPLSADFDGVVLRGSEGPGQRPLFSADRASVQLKILSFIHKRVDFRNIDLETPVIHLIADKNGISNLPKPESASPKSSSFSIFDLAVKHFVIHSGAVYYNDVSTPFEADLKNLQTQVDWRLLNQTYAGNLSYTDGSFKWADYAPIAHQANLQFAASRSDFSVEPLELGIGASHVTLRAKVDHFGNSQLHGSYQASVNTDDLRRVLAEPSIPRAEISLNGAVEFQSAGSRPLVEKLKLQGSFASREVAVRTSAYSGVVRDVRGEMLLENGNLHIAKFDGAVFDGHLSGAFEMAKILTSQDASLRASISRVSIPAAIAATGDASLRRFPVQGAIDGKATMNWRGSFTNVHANSDVTIRSSLGGKASPNAGIPVNGEFHLNYDGPNQSLAIARSYLRTDRTTLSLNGTLSKRSSIAVNLSTSDLQDVSALAANVMAVSGSSAENLQKVQSLRGPATLSAQVTGDVRNPRAIGSVSASSLQFDGSGFRVFKVDFDASPAKLVLKNGDLEPGNNGKISFAMSANLDHWSFSKDAPITAEISAHQIQAADIEKFANLNYPVGGLLNAKFSVEGSAGSPRGQGSLDLLQANVYGEPVQSVKLQIRGDGNSIHTTGDAKLTAGDLTADITYGPHNGTYSGQVSSKSMNLAALQRLQSRVPVSGKLVFNAKGSGTFEQPQVTADLSVDSLQVREQKISQLQAHLNVANQKADFTAKTNIGPGNLQAKGTVRLVGDYDSDISLDTNPFPISAMLAAYAPSAPTGLQGQTEIHATLRGPLKDRARLRGHLELPSLAVGYKDLQVSSASAIRVDFQNGLVTLQPAELRGNGTDLRVQGSAPVAGDGAFNASATGSVDLSLLKMLGTDIDSSGQIQLNVHARGNRTTPSLEGEMKVVNGVFSSESSPIGFEKVNAEMRIHNNRVEISQFQGQAGGGTVTLTGFALLGSQTSFRVGATAQNVRIRYPRGVRAILNGDLTLIGSPADSTLAGNIVIRRLSFTQEFDLTSFVSQFSGGPPSLEAPDFERHMKLSVGVQSRTDLALASSKVSVEGSADLRVQGTLADPVVIGRASLTSGELYFMGHRYDVQNGVITFSNPLQTTAAVNLNATTTVDQYNIALNFVGPLDRLRTTYSSTPSLPPADIINLLAFGKTQEEQATSPSTPASLGAESLLAQGVSSQVSGKVEKFSGLSQFEIDPVVGGEQSNPGARVALQQHITGNLIFSFSTDLSSTQQEVISLEYQTKKKMKIAVIRDEYGGYALNLRFHKDF